MTKSVFVCSLLIVGASVALMSLPIAAEVVRPKDGSGRPGDFTVGPWTGNCVRDGWLNGAKNESCGVQLKAEGRGFYLVRTVKGLDITLNVADCGPEVFKAEMGLQQLAAKGRVAQLETIIKGLFKNEDQKCGDPAAWAVPITKEDLSDILKETDGLNF